MQLFSTLDAAGICIYPLGERDEAVRQHFHSRYVYYLSSNWGSFHLHPDMKNLFPDEYKASVKCFHELFRLMREYGEDQDEFEIYTCSIGEENEPKRTHLLMDLKTFSLSDNFAFKDKQYIAVKV